MIVNPYFRPAAAAPAPLPAAPVAQSASTNRTSIGGDPMRALRAAVRPAAATPTLLPVSAPAPLRFEPPADARPILTANAGARLDSAVVPASATEIVIEAGSSMDRTAPPNGSLADAVAERLTVTHLAANPLRTRNVNEIGSPARAVNPLR
jgi:hypothetical protein